MKKRAEITWSLMHPTLLDVEYMERVVKEAAHSEVDSFELCAACHSLLGGLDGLALYEAFPAVHASLDADGIRRNREKLTRILDLAHGIGKPVYYWHREVTVWPEMLKSVPALLDENGEFDLLGEAYAALLRSKLEQAFAAVPSLDGVVLTLTEADFSAIHNSNPAKYPPEKVVERIAGIFAEELEKRGKRFILRSFGSIAQDYEDILAGAELAAKRHRFEVETKITPYDFNPFLPDNPFMRHIGALTLGAECDGLGEFLGAGYLPAENVENIVRYVRSAQKCGVDRFAIRIDRIGNTIFDSYPINLYAYTAAITDETLTADEIIRRYAEAHYPAACREQLIELGRQGLETVLKLNYIDHNLIFHQFPPQVTLKWLKAGGFFALFREHAPLKHLNGIWSILAGQNAPARAGLIAEKREALGLARQGLAAVQQLKESLTPAEYERLNRLWSNAVLAADSVLLFCECVAAYFEDMEELTRTPHRLHGVIGRMRTMLGRYAKDREAKRAGFFNGMDHSEFAYQQIEDVYPRPLLGMSELLVEEYANEFKVREELTLRKHCTDLIIPGAITDEWRCGRNMHACHAVNDDAGVGRIVGNQVFPNGFLDLELTGTGKAATLLIRGSGKFRLTVEGKTLTFECNGEKNLPLFPAERYELHFTKGEGTEYPRLAAVALR